MPANGETPVEVLLTPKPPANGTLQGKVTDDGGLPVRATVKLTDIKSGATFDAEPEGTAGFTAKLPGGDYLMDVSASGYMSKSRAIAVTAGQPVTVEVVLRKKPTVSHVSIGKTELNIKGTIHFGTNNAELRPDGEQLLDEVADVLVKNLQLKKIRVEGHTDNRGSAIENLDHSRARAAAVRRWLVENGKIAPERITAQGYGPDKPIADNKTETGRAKNRRVEIMFAERHDPTPLP